MPCEKNIIDQHYNIFSHLKYLINKKIYMLPSDN